MKTITRGNAGPRIESAIKALAALWALFLVMIVLRDTITGQYDMRIYFLHRVAVAALGITLSVGMLAILSLLPDRPLTLRGVGVCLLSFPAALALVLGDFACIYLWTPAPDDASDLARLGIAHMAAQVVAVFFIGSYFIFAAWGAVFLVLTYAEDVRRSERRASEQRDQARIAELRMLKGQINPHFMFNMLNSLSALVMRESRSEAEALISEMAAFLRVNLDSEPLDDVTLREECDLQDRYLRLEGRRFPQRLFAKFDLDEATEDLLVPAMILQPLIENSVRHGVGRTLTAVNVRVRARILGRGLEIVVEDDAQRSARLPIDDDTAGFGMGLKNVQARLDARYDGAAEFEAGPLPHRGFRVRMLIPETRHG